MLGARRRHPPGAHGQGTRLASITTIEAANRFINDTYLPDHNRRFAIPPELEGSAFVPLLRPDQIDDILCLHAQRIVGRDDTMNWILQPPASPGLSRLVVIMVLAVIRVEERQTRLAHSQYLSETG